VDFEEMAAEQNRCPETQRLLGGTSLKLLSARQALNAWLEMFPQATFALLSPSNSEKTIFDHFHNVVHPGRLASHRIISSRFVWRSLSRDVTAWLGPRVSGLTAGQDPPPHTPGPLTHYIPQRRFSHLHVNLVGPLQYSNNFNYSTYLLLLIAHTNGLKLFPFQKRPRRHAQKL
jgi:hypothetical protein